MMAVEVLPTSQAPAPASGQVGLGGMDCRRACAILLDDLRPDPVLNVGAEEYAAFLWHMCRCPRCLAYEHALESPLVASAR